MRAKWKTPCSAFLPSRPPRSSGCLAVWKVPERLEITDTWPVTATGKVQKHVLRDALRARRRSGRPLIMKQTDAD